MSWLFCYYVETRYGCIYRFPNPWFNQEAILEACPGAIFHCSESHKIHAIGGFLKNFGLRTCMIIEVQSDAEAMVLRLMDDQVVSMDHSMKSKPPSLQLILENPDMKTLDELSQPLIEYKRGDAKRRSDNRACQTLQKQVDRVVMTIEDLEGSISTEFIEKASAFVDSSLQEIERIRNEGRVESRKATAARKALQKKLLSFSTYIKPAP